MNDRTQVTAYIGTGETHAFYQRQTGRESLVADETYARMGRPVPVRVPPDGPHTAVEDYCYVDAVDGLKHVVAVCDTCGWTVNTLPEHVDGAADRHRLQVAARGGKVVDA
jgi:hypothetical protein